MTPVPIVVSNRLEALQVQDDAAQNSSMPYRAPGRESDVV